MIGRILTLGLGSWGGKTLLTLGYSPKAVSTRRIHGGDDEIDYGLEKKVRRAVRIRQEDEAIIRIVVSCITEGLL